MLIQKPASSTMVNWSDYPSSYDSSNVAKLVETNQSACFLFKKVGDM